MKKKKILANDGMSKAGVEILENAGFEHKPFHKTVRLKTSMQTA